jgi:hypothetical protein
VEQVLVRWTCFNDALATWEDSQLFDNNSLEPSLGGKQSRKGGDVSDCSLETRGWWENEHRC